MNYLAHIALSRRNESLQVGNFIGDFVKGKAYDNYTSEIKRGILLHRKIDHFTDNQDDVRACVELLRPEFGRYSAIVVDLYFDYFLANSIEQYFAKRTLSGIAFHFYLAAVWHYFVLPPKVKNFIWHFILTNRLCKYRTLEGLRESMEIMERHKTPHISPDKAIHLLEENMKFLESRFHSFFPDLLVFVNESSFS